MCGIAGLINCGDQPALQAMVDVIAHRGPDSEGLKWFPFAHSGIAHRRLAILDLSPAGHQPMATDEGRYWITYNGELYNFTEIRSQLQQHGFHFKSQSDTEVLLKAYQHWGPDCLSKLNGMFAFAIYDTHTHTLFAARDRFGIKPFYYFCEGARFIFGSEIKAILASGLVKAEPDDFALHTPARFQLSPLTGFRQIFKLAPAHSLTFRDDQLQITQYWKLSPTEDHTISESAAVDRLDHLLNDAVRLQMIADVPVGVFLSGGVDSSLISALARKNTNHDIHSFTIRYSDQDQKLERATPDEIFARQVAKGFGFVYHELELDANVVDLLPQMVWHLDEPVSEPASINTYLISRAARERGIVVLLNGMAGDEVFGGYLKHLACLNAETYQRLLPRTVRRGVESLVKQVPIATSRHGSKSMRRIKRFFSFASLPRTMRYLMSDASLSADQYHDQFLGEIGYHETHFVRTQQPMMDRQGLAYLTAMCLNDTNVFLPEHNLTFSDKGSMAAGVESRPPMTDHRVIEFMFTLPPAFRIKGATQKYLLKKLAARYLPRNIVYRPKANFASPLRSWIRGPLAPMVNDLLSEQSIRDRGLYKPGYVKELIRKNSAGIEDHAYTLWTLLTNEIWFRTFFSSSTPSVASMNNTGKLQVPNG